MGLCCFPDDNAKIQPQKRLVKYFGIFLSVKTLS